MEAHGESSLDKLTQNATKDSSHLILDTRPRVEEGAPLQNAEDLCSQFVLDLVIFAKRNAYFSFLDAVLRGFGQVYFQNSSFTGLCCLVAILVYSPFLSVFAVLGCCVSTATAYVLGMSQPVVDNGLRRRL